MAVEKTYHPKFIVDADGHQTAVILPIAEYHELLEDLADLAIAAERSGESTIPHAQVIEALKTDGILPD